jgi:hypothetical protein
MMIEPTRGGLSKLGAALDYLTHGNVEVLTRMMVSADVFHDKKFHDGRQIHGARDTRNIMRSGRIDPERLHTVEQQLMPRIRHAGYDSLEKLMAGMNDAGEVVPRRAKPPKPGKPAKN